MTSPSLTPEERAELYIRQRRLTISDRLGSGQEGIVLGTDRATAIQVFRYAAHYRRERDVYLRLMERAVQKVAGFNVPTITDHENTLLVVEMTIVSAPFVLDFATAGLDEPIHLDAEGWQAWEEDLRDRFDDDYRTVRLVYFALQRYGVFLNDIHPGNIRCR